MEKYEPGSLIGPDRYRIEELVALAGESERCDRYRATDEIIERDVLISISPSNDERTIATARAPGIFQLALQHEFAAFFEIFWLVAGDAD